VPYLLDLESRILRALCTGSPAVGILGTHHSSSLAAILVELRAHEWQHPEHRVVFDALTQLQGRDGTELREQLPAQATRMGFPDVNWHEYFTERGENASIETLVAELLTASPE
jgi:hypothetical protein